MEMQNLAFDQSEKDILCSRGTMLKQWSSRETVLLSCCNRRCRLLLFGFESHRALEGEDLVFIHALQHFNLEL